MNNSQSIFSFRYGIFDLDGTLIDSMPLYIATFGDLIAEYGADRVPATEYYIESMGIPVDIQFR